MSKPVPASPVCESKPMAEKGWKVLGLMAVDGGRVTNDVGAEVALASVLELKVRMASSARFAVTESGSIRFCANTHGTERSMTKSAAFHGVIGDFICMPPVFVERCLSVKVCLFFSIGKRLRDCRGKRRTACDSHFEIEICKKLVQRVVCAGVYAPR